MMPKMIAPIGRMASASVSVERDVRPRLAERRRDVVDDEREDEEVEGVERPAEKAGEHGVALVDAVLRGSWERQDACAADMGAALSI